MMSLCYYTFRLSLVNLDRNLSEKMRRPEGQTLEFGSLFAFAFH